MNVVFLDVDGVLNSINKLKEVYKVTLKSHSGINYPFDEKCLINLANLVYMSNSKIVIISTWKNNKEYLEKLYTILDFYGLLDRVDGITKTMESRELEIKDYLINNSKISNFIILDDDANYELLFDFLIKTNIQTGFTYNDLCLGLKKLNSFREYN